MGIIFSGFIKDIERKEIVDCLYIQVFALKGTTRLFLHGGMNTILAFCYLWNEHSLNNNYIGYNINYCNPFLYGEMPLTCSFGK